MPVLKWPTRRRWLWGAAVFVVLLLGFAGWVGFRTLQAYNNLKAAKDTIAVETQKSLTELAGTDPAEISRLIGQVQANAQRARNAVDDPLFRLATGFPLVGDDLSAVSSVALALDDLSQNVLPSMVSLLELADPSQLSMRAGSIDLAPLISASTTLRDADLRVSANVGRIDAVDRSTLTSAVRGGVDELAAALKRLAAVTSEGAKLTRLLPPMLGSGGVRRYLVVFQNLAELRSTGGIFGSYAVLTVDNGKLSFGGQGSSARDMGRFSDPVAPLTPEQLGLYGANIATIPMDVNFTPDFPLAARLFAAMYQQRIDPAPIDGVIAIDPVALADILKGFEPVAVGNTKLVSDTLVKTLLSDAYTLFPGTNDEEQRDQYLAVATAAAFAEITGNPRDAGAVVRALRDSANDRRLLFYSSHREEQSLISEADYAGELPAVDDAATPTFGVFLNDRTYAGSKLAYYLSGAADLAAGSCNADGSRDVTLTVHLDFDAPSSGLPEHVSGAGPIPYVLVTEVRVFAPTGGTLVAAEFDDAAVPFDSATDLNRSAAKFTVNLLPGTSSTVALHFRLAPAPDTSATVRPSIYMAPAVTNWPMTEPAFTGCG